jgi:AraC-like DNA-binding protein
MLELRTKPVERVVFRGSLVAFGQFRCGAGHRLFRDSGPCTHHTFVFPRTSTVIRHAGGRPFVATPNCATLYNEGQEYTREAISAADVSDWFVVDAGVVGETLGDERRPFRRAHVPVDAATFLEQRFLFENAARLDPEDVEERVLQLFGRVAGADGNDSRDDVEAVKARIAACPEANESLRALAGAIGRSPFHLCRAFRRHTGQSINEYKHSLRLRLALESLEAGDIADLALRLGYATHSHFTSAFRRRFGITPSQYAHDRDSVAARRARTLSG